MSGRADGLRAFAAGHRLSLLEMPNRQSERRDWRFQSSDAASETYVRHRAERKRAWSTLHNGYEKCSGPRSWAHNGRFVH